MKRFLDKNRTELLFFLFLALFSGVLAVWSELKPKNHYVQLVLALFLLAFGIPMYLLLRSIWRKKLRDPIITGIKKAFVRASRLFMRAVSKLPFLRLRGNIISGSTSVSYDLFAVSKNKSRRKEKPPKPPRWKDMTTARERLGYLYYRIITKHIKNGAVITAHETPHEISKRLESDKTEHEILTLYKSTRYDDRKTLDEEEIIKLKEELFDK